MDKVRTVFDTIPRGDTTVTDCIWTLNVCICVCVFACVCAKIYTQPEKFGHSRSLKFCMLFREGKMCSRNRVYRFQK